MADQTCIQSPPQLASAPLLVPPPPQPQPPSPPIPAQPAASDADARPGTAMPAAAGGQINLTASPVTPAPAPALPNHVSAPPVSLVSSPAHKPDPPLLTTQSLVPVPSGTAVPAACITEPSSSTTTTTTTSTCITDSLPAASPLAAVTTISTLTTTTSASPTVQTAVTTCGPVVTTPTTSAPVVPVPTAKRVILTAHTQSVLNAPIRTSSLPNGNVVGPLVTRSNIVTGNQSAIQSSPSPSLQSAAHPVVLQTGSPAIITNNGPAVAAVKQQQPLLTSPATTSGLVNHQLVLNNSAGNKLQQQPAPQQQVPAAGQSTVIFTHDGQKAMMTLQPSSGIVNQGVVTGSPARVLPTISSSNNNNNNNNVISSGATTVLLGKPVQSQPNIQTQLTPAIGQLPQQQPQQQQQQLPQQIHHPQQQVVVSNPQMQTQMVHIRTPSGQVMQLTPQQQGGMQRQLAPRPNFILSGNSPIRIQQPVRPGQQPVHPQGATSFRPGTPSNCILIKTETGYQLVPLSQLGPGQSPIRFTVPVSSAGAPMQQQMSPFRQQIVSINAQPQIRTGMPPQQQQQQQAQQQQQPQQLQQVQVQPQMNQPLSIQTAQANSQASAANSQSQMSPNTAKRKCKNFLSTLIRLATDQPEHVAQNVRKLIQGLIDGNIIPEDFTNQLQRELNSSPQPCLIPFLKKSLPHLKQSLMLGELTIEGVNPPPRTPLNQPPLPLQFQRPPAGIRFVTTASPLNFQPGAIVQTPQQQLLQQQQQQRPQMSAQTPVGGTTALQSGPPAPATPAPKAKSKAKPRASTTPKDKDKKISNSLREDDDINDVAAMGGVNLAEENQRMAAAANEVGTQIRSCKDETFFLTNTLATKISRITAKFSLEEPSADVISLISHAAQERVKTLVERLGVIAEHRLEVFKVDPKYEVAQDVRSQIKFLEELDKMEKRRHEEQEREMLLKAAKSRSKLEDPEQLKLKAKAKEMQRAEMEEARQREANETALLAIGPRKKLKLDSSPSLTSTPSAAAGSAASAGSSIAGSAGSAGGIHFTPFNNNAMPSNHFNSIYSTPFSSSKGPMRRMTKRVYMKDLLFLMEQDRSTSKSAFLYKSYTK